MVSRPRTTLVFVWLVGCFVSIVICSSSAFAATQNTLQNNGKWFSSKTTLARGVMGSQSFMKDALALAKNNLNLGTWHGFQEVYTKQSYEANKISFRFFLGPESYVTFLSKDGNAIVGFRFSANSKLPSKCLRIDKSGQFIETKDVSHSFSHSKWHEVSIVFDRNGYTVSSSDFTARCDYTTSHNRYIGFRGSYQESVVDDVKIYGLQEILFKDSFTYKFSYLNKMMIFIVIGLFVLFSAIFSRTMNRKKILFILLISSVSLSVILFRLIAFPVLFQRYPDLNVRSMFSTKQTVSVVNDDFSKHAERIRQANKDKVRPCVLFIGSSQTWGAGASTESNTYVAKFDSMLNGGEPNLSSSTHKDSIINAGYSGMDSNSVLKWYETAWSSLQSKVVIINLASNDRLFKVPIEQYYSNLEKMIQFNKSQQIQTILLLEAESFEKSNDNPYHDVMIKLATKEQVQIVNMNEYLRSIADTGFLWWDYVHPTDYGHEQLAKYLYEQLGSTIKSICSGELSPEIPLGQSSKMY